jgi:hypothetical protein
MVNASIVRIMREPKVREKHVDLMSASNEKNSTKMEHAKCVHHLLESLTTAKAAQQMNVKSARN